MQAFVPLIDASCHFKNFPTSFCDYSQKIVMEEFSTEVREDFYRIVAKKVALLYVTTLQAKAKFLKEQRRIDKTPFDLDNAMLSVDLFKHILFKLRHNDSVHLYTDKVPQGELQEILQKSRIDLVTPAKDDIYFLPYRSFVYISPRIMEEHGSVVGLDISIQRD